MRSMEECDGYRSLLAAVEKDELKSPGHHDYRGKLQWVIERVKYYADKMGVDAADLLDAWEKQRNYWYMNYYQDCNQPLIDEGKVRVFSTVDDLMSAIGDKGFRCPKCDGVSRDPYCCTCEGCDWTAFGLFRTLGKGVTVVVVEKLQSNHIFMPIAWEER
ncbi:MAG: hypothetical protein PHI12_09780 [Dehalococcoidales bacterium]|nr:hypothetical protein [Dehalococcoidales bacterium]